MNVTRLRPSDYALASFIVENLLDDADERVSAAHLETLLQDERTYLLAAQEGEEVLGFALAYRFPSLYADENMAYLYDIEVVEAHRRKGVGRLLVENLKTLLEKDDVGELWLGTGEDNAAGQALFSKTGGERSHEKFHDFTYEL